MKPSPVSAFSGGRTSPSPPPMPEIHELLAMLSAALFGGLTLILVVRALWLQFLYSRYHAAGGQLSFRTWSHTHPPMPSPEHAEELPLQEPDKPALEAEELMA